MRGDDNRTGELFSYVDLEARVRRGLTFADGHAERVTAPHMIEPRKDNSRTPPASGRGWVAIGTTGRHVGHFYIYHGDDQPSSANATE